MIGSQKAPPEGHDPALTRGTAFAPFMIGRFTTVRRTENLLEIFYTLSTWNPYAVVLMKSEFKIGD
jgi:hypothetical protein